MKEIVQTLIQTVQTSAEALRARISNVQYGDVASNQIKFQLDGKSMVGYLKGRNADLLLGFGTEQDKAIACRVLLDS